MAATGNYPWHLYMRPPQMLGPNVQHPSSISQTVPPKQLLLPSPESSPVNVITHDTKPVKLSFGTFVDVLNPLNFPKQQRQRSSSTSSDTTVEIPRSHPFPTYYYWHPNPNGTTPLSYYAASHPPRPHFTTPRSKLPPHLDGHNYSSESEIEKPAKRKDKKNNTNSTLLRHYCAKCGRPRSRRYQRENPIKKGVMPSLKICSRCIPPKPQESASEEGCSDDKATEDAPLPQKRRSSANEEIEEIFIRRGRGRLSFFRRQPPPIESVRITRRRTSSSPDDDSNEDCKSSGSSVHYQRIRIGMEGDEKNRLQPAQDARPSNAEKGSHRYRLVDDEDPKMNKSKLQKQHKEQQQQQPARGKPDQESSEDSGNEPQPPREPSPPRLRRTVYRYNVVERAKADEPRSAQPPAKKSTDRTTSKQGDSSPPRERSPLRLRVRYVPGSDEQADAPAKHCGKAKEKKQPPKSRDTPLSKSNPVKETYQVVLVDRADAADSGSDCSNPLSKPRAPSPPEWYYRQYRRYNIPVEDPTTPTQPLRGNERRTRLDTQGSLPPPRRYASPKNSFRRLAHAIMPSQARRNAPRSDFRSGKEKQSHYDRYMSESSDETDDDEPRASRVRFVAGTKINGKGSGIPCTSTTSGEKAMQRQREAVEDWEEERHDQHNLNRAKRIVNHRGREGGGAFELDGHHSDGGLERREMSKVMRWDDGVERV